MASTVNSSHNQNHITQLTSSSQLAQPNPAPILQAYFKQSPQDFEVNEILDIDLSGQGEHLWLLIQKTGMNTSFVADQLAKWANIPSRDVGYSGLKDRQAVTTQWFSLRLPKGELPETSFEDFMTTVANQHDSATQRQNIYRQESIAILEQDWHSKKLNRGTHKANHFVIRLTQIELDAKVATSTSDVDAILDALIKTGVPNYFGEQRFGINGNNIVKALEWLEQGTINGRKPHPKKSRDLQSMLLSSARSAIFNQILAKRVEDSCWNEGLDGDVFNLDGSGSIFACEQIDSEIQARLASGDIHPTAPLWGIKNDKVTGAAKALEDSVVAHNPTLKSLAQGLEAREIKTMRRALRLPIANLNHHWEDKYTLALDFSLPTGTFATSVLSSLVNDLRS